MLSNWFFSITNAVSHSDDMALDSLLIGHTTPESHSNTKKAGGAYHTRKFLAIDDGHLRSLHIFIIKKRTPRRPFKR